jgi:hypothetical protein
MSRRTMVVNLAASLKVVTNNVLIQLGNNIWVDISNKTITVVVKTTIKVVVLLVKVIRTTEVTKTTRWVA